MRSQVELGSNPNLRSLLPKPSSSELVLVPVVVRLESPKQTRIGGFSSHSFTERKGKQREGRTSNSLSSPKAPSSMRALVVRKSESNLRDW